MNNHCEPIGSWAVRSGWVGQSFVAHIWLERAAGGELMWRGHIRHVQSRQERYFDQFNELRDFVESVAGDPGHGGRKRRDGGSSSN
jgi:hypothetical protein